MKVEKKQPHQEKEDLEKKQPHQEKEDLEKKQRHREKEDLEKKQPHQEKKQQPAVATERKGMTTRSRRPSGGEAASKSQKVEDGDEAAKGKVGIAKCSQEYIDWLLRLEREKTIRSVNMKGYTGPDDLRESLLRSNEAMRKMLDSHADILQQYRASGVAYTEVVYERSV